MNKHRDFVIGTVFHSPQFIQYDNSTNELLYIIIANTHKNVNNDNVVKPHKIYILALLEETNNLLNIFVI